MQKFALIPVDAVARFQAASNLQSSGPLAQIKQHEDKLSSILETKALPADVQKRLFNDAFAQFSQYKEAELNQPLKVPLVQNEPAAAVAPAALRPPPPPLSPAPVGPAPAPAPAAAQPERVGAFPADPEALVAAIPLTYRQRARNLIDAIRQNARIGWDEQTGEVVVNGRQITGSDADTIIHDLARNRVVEAAPGSLAVGSALLEAGVRPSVFGNSARKKEIVNMQLGRGKTIKKKKKLRFVPLYH